MYWVLDIFVILFLITTIYFGWRRGFVKILGGVIGGILLVVLAIAMGFGFLLLFFKLGAINNMAYGLLGLIGETNSLFSLLGVSSYDVCEILSAVLILIIGLILSTIICTYIGKIFKNIANNSFYGKEHRPTFFRILNKILGVILYLALYAVLVLGLLAVVKALADSGVAVFVSFDEFLRSCTVTGWIYSINPLNGLISF